MKHIFFNLPILALIAVFVCGVSAQNNAKLECPGTLVLSSADAVTDGEMVTFHVERMGGNIDVGLLEYNWTLDRGRIVSGQGTPVVIVGSSGVGAAGSVTATVEITPSRECSCVTSQTSYVRRKGPPTNADMFWEWLWFNGANPQFSELSENADIAKEVRERLDQVDPNLTLELGTREDGGKREIIVGHKGNPYDSKAVTEFVARAPNLVIANIVFMNSSIFHPPPIH